MREPGTKGRVPLSEIDRREVRRFENERSYFTLGREFDPYPGSNRLGEHDNA